MTSDEWDEETIPDARKAFPSSVPTDAPPTERELEIPTEVPETPVTMPAPPFIPNDKDRDKLPLDLREWRSG